MAKRNTNYRNRRRRVRKMKRGMRNNGIALKTKRMVTTYVAATAGNQYAGIFFKLSDLPNYTEFTALFDQYKITGVRVRIIPYQNSAEYGGAGTSILYSVFDYTDATAPANVNTLLEYPTCKIKRLDRPVSLFFRPKVADALYQTAAFTGYGVSRQWLSTASSDIQYYGWKYAMQVPTTTSFQFVYTYYLQLKNVK